MGKWKWVWSNRGNWPHIHSREKLCSYLSLFYWPCRPSHPKHTAGQEPGWWKRSPFKLISLIFMECLLSAHRNCLGRYILSLPTQVKLPPVLAGSSLVLPYINLFSRNYHTVFSWPLGYFKHCEFLSYSSAFCRTQNTFMKNFSIAPYMRQALF